MKKWKYKEGSLATIFIITLGYIMQIILEGEVIRPAEYPWTLIIGLIFTFSLLALYYVFKNNSLIKWLCSVYAALPAIIGFIFLVILMGLTNQSNSTGNVVIRILGLNNMTKSWPFILINLYLIILLGLVTFSRLKKFNSRNIGFFLNHFGLYLVLISTSLASTDLKRISMNCYENQTEWKGIDESGKEHELPFAIKLIDFKIDEFRPKIAILDNKTSKIAEINGKPLIGLLENESLKIGTYEILVDKYFESSGKLGDSYHPVNEPGTAPSALVRIKKTNGEISSESWLSSGSYSLQPEAIKIDEKYSLIMLPPEARVYSSVVNIISKSGKNFNTTIEVNKPLSIDGWKVYQLSYDKDLGRWSTLSVLEFVRDPWLPVVYSGIFLIMAGAGFIFFYGKPKEGGARNVN